MNYRKNAPLGSKFIPKSCTFNSSFLRRSFPLPRRLSKSYAVGDIYGVAIAINFYHSLTLLIMKYFFLVFALACTFSLSAQSTNDVQNLVATLLGETPIEEDLQELCDKIGGRVPGTEANEKAVEWGLDKFRSSGVNADLEPFEMPVKWIPRETNAELTGDLNYLPRMVAKYKAPAGRFAGDLIYVGMGTDADFAKLKASVKGKIVLVETDLCLDINGLFAEYAAATTAEINARKAGVKAVVFMSSRPRGLLYRFLTMQGTDNNLPQFVMAREDAQRCIRVLEDGGTMEINIYNQAEAGAAFIANNVIAEIRGSEYPDEIVVIGSHIDSWALGTGANDNGCNVSMMIDIARQMKKLGIQPKRTIRFALWNGEEQGY
ncbi:MAG: M28 family peptidase, partial [Saprospiraceae bacterium]